jgi:glycosyltransferase involved in cell wall biosynthesis
MTPPRIFVLSPDHDAPSGGIRRLYRHVDVLCRHGLAAFVLHHKPEFRCSWFPNTTSITGFGQALLTPDDYLVVPEVYGPGIDELAPGVPKVIFNQNAYLTFAGFPVEGAGIPAPYLHRDVVGVFAVSEDNASYLRYAFPGLTVHRLHYGIDPIFAPRWPKRKALAYMPRKHAEDIVQVFNILRYRKVFTAWDLIALDSLLEAQVAELLSRCAVFLSFGYPEGCPLPPLEAMASGCVVVGYHGRGGREYFDPAFSYPIEAGDVVGFARAVEELIQQDRETPSLLEDQGKRAAEFVRSRFSPELEENDIVQRWREILGNRWA